MRMIVDANILLSAVLGSAVKLQQAQSRGLILLMPDVQLQEAVNVLVKKMGWDIAAAREAVCLFTEFILIFDVNVLRSVEMESRQLLTKRGQPDWPVLAAAMMLNAHIWSNDRDFFGVGVPVWSNDNIRFANATGS